MHKIILLLSALFLLCPFTALPQETCEGNFDCDMDVDSSDAAAFKADFGRSTMLNPCTTALPCNGDFDCDKDVDSSDAATFEEDFGRSTILNPCSACVVEAWCEYPIASSTTSTCSFRTCGDVYPQDCIGGCGGSTCCGNGIIDLYDVLEMDDIILGLQTATACQIANGDVPNGTPPYCGNPPGTPNCESDGDIDMFDRKVINDKALGRMNCCDYCLFGRIY